MKYFKEKEFLCKCGKCGKGYEKIEKELLEKLEKAREIAGVPFRLNSAYRCEEHNDWVGGSTTSRHMKGQAVDIMVKNSNERYLIMNALLKVGFNSIGVYSSFIHCDISNRNVMWYK